MCIRDRGLVGGRTSPWSLAQRCGDQLVDRRRLHCLGAPLAATRGTTGGDECQRCGEQGKHGTSVLITHSHIMPPIVRLLGVRTRRQVNIYAFWRITCCPTTFYAVPRDTPKELLNST